MSTTSDIWLAFARTFSVLFAVLALLILIFYLIKRLSGANNNKSGSYIKVLSTHHLSPKEKLVLLNVLGETLLVGVTPNQISKLTAIETDLDFTENEKAGKHLFSDFLGRGMKRPLHIKVNGPQQKDQAS